MGQPTYWRYVKAIEDFVKRRPRTIALALLPLFVFEYQYRTIEWELLQHRLRWTRPMPRLMYLEVFRCEVAPPGCDRSQDDMESYLREAATNPEWEGVKAAYQSIYDVRGFLDNENISGLNLASKPYWDSAFLMVAEDYQNGREFRASEDEAARKAGLPRIPVDERLDWSKSLWAISELGVDFLNSEEGAVVMFAVYSLAPNEPLLTPFTFNEEYAEAEDLLVDWATSFNEVVGVSSAFRPLGFNDQSIAEVARDFGFPDHWYWRRTHCLTLHADSAMTLKDFLSSPRWEGFVEQIDDLVHQGVFRDMKDGRVQVVIMPLPGLEAFM